VTQAVADKFVSRADALKVSIDSFGTNIPCSTIVT
jgi:hypothetical protein